MKNQEKNIKIPESAKKVLSLLEKNGHTAYIVGGFVRDQILAEDTAPTDIDIATSATPDQTEHLFAGPDWTSYPLGKEFGTIGVVPKTLTKTVGSGALIKNTKRGIKNSAPVPVNTFEITTYRSEQSYSDGRHPDEVVFGTSIEGDLARRDFTCNAIACDINGELLDPFGGIDDIHNNIVKCVGEPRLRFQEDHLRILRALRFASQLGFKIDETTEAALIAAQKNITTVSAQRIRDELTKLLCGKNAAEVLTIYSKVLFEVVPELAPLYKFDQKTKYHSHDAWEHTIIVLDKMPAGNSEDLAIAMGKWAALLHDIGKPDCFTLDDHGQGHFYGHPARSVELAKPILRRLKFTKKMSDSILLLIRYHDQQMAATKKSVKRMLNKFSQVSTELSTPEMFCIYCDLRRADSYAHDENFRGYLTFTNQIQTVFDDIISEAEAFSLHDLAIGGKDIMNMGVKPGPQISQILEACLEAVINDEVKNNKIDLLAYASKVNL